MDHDIAEFAVETIRRWLRSMGQPAHPDATRLLITADDGGSNGSQRKKAQAGRRTHRARSFPTSRLMWNIDGSKRKGASAPALFRYWIP
jgi:hypothetical protein